MKVAFITRSTLFHSRGGDTIQAIKTAQYLRDAGIEVDIIPTHQAINYSGYDLLHFFNLTRPADILQHLYKTTKPFVLSPIWIDYGQYDKNYRKGLSGKLFRHLPAPMVEYSKRIARWLLQKEQFPTWRYLLKGQKKSIAHTLTKTSLLLPNSGMEYDQLTKEYARLPSYMTIPNGVDTTLFNYQAQVAKDADLVICIARIEGLKNQYNLIKALNNTAYRLIIIGAPATHQYQYYRSCRAIAASNVSFIDQLSQEELIPYYQKAKVHVLPSWFETCGLSSLEAAAMGCNIVITEKGYTREYFEDYATYCDPASPDSIRQAIEKAVNTPFQETLRHKIINNYTWQHAAEKTLKAYRQVLQ
jgi:glycosyltransferase involved in cell wall biosynthesis